MAKTINKKGFALPVKESDISFETFKSFGAWERGHLEQKNPSCFNGFVNFRKRRVTVELIEESTEVLAERLQKMWDECNNRHNWGPLESAAESIGYKLIGSPGTKK